MQTTTIRPGLLVSLKTSVTGNVSYRKRDLERERVTETGEAKARWETERTIADPAEFEEATKIRGKARSLISAICSHSTFGLLCPQADTDGLNAAIEEAQQLAADFNSRARVTRVQVYVIAGKIAADDEQAARAINSEVRELLDRMESGVRNLDVEAIRDAANKARALGNMMAPEASTRLQMAIDAARSAARRLVKAGETAAEQVDMRAIRAITEGRTMFLDLDDAGEVAAPTVASRAVDFDTTPTTTQAAPIQAAAPMLDL